MGLEQPHLKGFLMIKPEHIPFFEMSLLVEFSKGGANHE